MNGLNITLEQMKAARARGESHSDFARIHARLNEGCEPQKDADSPDARILFARLSLNNVEDQRGRLQPSRSLFV